VPVEADQQLVRQGVVPPQPGAKRETGAEEFRRHASLGILARGVTAALASHAVLFQHSRRRRFRGKRGDAPK
jgi:hypothetical protein